MITNIALKNFKCFSRVEVSPKQVTLFIGPNGSGKSGVLQALLLLKQSKDASKQLDLSGPMFNLPQDDFMFRGIPPESGKVGLSLSGYWNLPSGEIETPVKFDVGLEYSHSGEMVRVNESKASATHLKKQIETHAGKWDATPAPEHLVDALIAPFKPESGNAVSGDPDIEHLREKVRQAPMTLMDCLRAVPTSRGFTRQDHALSNAPPQEISLTSGLGQEEDAIVSALVYAQSEVNRLSNWMKKVTDVAFITEFKSPQSVRPASNTTVGPDSLLSEGFGTNSLVLLLFQLARAEKGATVLIEEPEIHLHPRAQAELASVIAEEAKDAGKQVIMTTHSEHILGRLLTLVAERRLSIDDLAIYFFDKDEGGVCSASLLEVTPRGQVMGGLKSFFETDMDEMRRYVDALRTHE